MLLIALSWLYILFTAVNLGVLVNKLMVPKNNNLVVTAILGLFAATLLASIWAIFGRINIEFHVFLLVLNGLLFWGYSAGVTKIYADFSFAMRSLTLGLKCFLVLITFLIIAQCASVPYVIDNESYYIQTIKWLNGYGFVKGLVNLHFFFGQVSGWHIAQSVFNFSFLYQNFNDLSGFCLLLGNIFAVEKLNGYFKNGHKNYLIAGLLPLANIFFFQFISAPSPDIPVYVCTFIVLFYFIENYKSCTAENFNLILILVLFLLYIKNTTVAFALIPAVLFVLHFKTISRNWPKPFIICFLVLALFIVKNLIICGSPVFPSRLFDATTFDYAIPPEMETFYQHELKLYGYFVTAEQYETMSALQLFRQWLMLPKLNGLFNKLAILLVLASPVFIWRFFNKKAVWVLYAVMLVQLLILFATSPQYRFFMNFILFFSVFCFSCIFRNRKLIAAFLYLSLLPVLVILYLPVDLNAFSNHKFMQRISNFSAANYLYPHRNTKYDSGFEKVTNGNLSYNSPLYNGFFWGSGDGELPCVNKLQIAYFEQYYHFKPQLRTNDLKDGFYAKRTQPAAR